MKYSLPPSQKDFNEQTSSKIEVSKKIIEKIKLCCLNEGLLTKSSLESVKTDNPIKYLNSIKGNLQLQISNSSNEKIKSLKENFEEGFERLENEIQNTYENDILCTNFRNELNTKIKLNKKKSFYNFIKTNSFRKINDKNEDHIAFLEQWSSIGHPIHPCYKSKPEMTKEDVLKYSPEFHRTIELNLIAVHNSIFNVEMPSIKAEYKNWLSEQYSFQNDVDKELLKLGLNPSDYNLIPAHPWQVKNILPKWFKHLFENRKLVVLQNSSIPASSSISFRSMSPLVKDSYNIKVPITLQMTSVVRYISPAKLYNSVYISELVNKILEIESHFNDTLDLMAEDVCVTIKESHEDSVSEISTRHLSAIFRRKPIYYLEKNEIGVPLASLFIESPITLKPILIEILEDHNLINKKNKQQSTINYFKDFAQKAIQGPIGIYLKYGVNLESHQQNIILVFKNGFLKKLLVRDSSGVDIHKPSFDKTGLDLELHPKTNQFYDDRGLRVHLIHCLFNSHLAEVIKALSSEYQVSESELWKELYVLVEAEINKYRDLMKPEEWQAEKDAILKDKWVYKALLLMRIANTKEIFLDMDNPFVKT